MVFYQGLYVIKVKNLLLITVRHHLCVCQNLFFRFIVVTLLIIYNFVNNIVITTIINSYK